MGRVSSKFSSEVDGDDVIHWVGGCGVNYGFRSSAVNHLHYCRSHCVNSVL